MTACIKRLSVEVGFMTEATVWFYRCGGRYERKEEPNLEAQAEQCGTGCAFRLVLATVYHHRAYSSRSLEIFSVNLFLSFGLITSTFTSFFHGDEDLFFPVMVPSNNSAERQEAGKR